MRWAVEIQSTSLEARNLSDLLIQLGFKLEQGTESLALTSPEIDGCATAADAFEIARRVRAAFRGPAGIDPDFQLGSVLDFSTEPPRRHAFLEAKSISLSVSVGTPTVTISPPINLSDDELKSWTQEQREHDYQAKLDGQLTRLVPTYHYKNAERVIRLLSEEQTTADKLYKIYELMEGNPDNRREFQARFSISKDEFLRFKDAVHNPSVTGDWARHAYDHPPKTDNPMSRTEAETYVKKLARRWLAELRNSSG